MGRWRMGNQENDCKSMKRVEFKLKSSYDPVTHQWWCLQWWSTTESSTCLEMCKWRSQTDKEMNTGIRAVIRRTGDSICFLLLMLSQTLLRGWVLNSLHSLLGLENWSKQETFKDFASFSFLSFWNQRH